MMTIKDLAADAGVPAHVARYYVRIGLITPVGQEENGYRCFSKGAVERIRFIRRAQKRVGHAASKVWPRQSTSRVGKACERRTGRSQFKRVQRSPTWLVGWPFGSPANVSIPCRTACNGLGPFSAQNSLTRTICGALGLPYLPHGPLRFSLKEIRLIFSEVEANKSPCADVREMLAHRIEENRKKIAELTALQARMESAQSLWNWMPDSQSGKDGHNYCPLIEGVTHAETFLPESRSQREVRDAKC